jgi:hypothetical protein
MAGIQNKMTALRKGQKVVVVVKAHDEWKTMARQLWPQLNEADQKAVNEKRMELEAMFAERQKPAPAEPAHDPETGVPMRYEERTEAA